jgi:ATP-dependent Clp protease ATP-binding subunit ClpA
MPESDPIDEIQTALQHAREAEQTNTQQHLDRISLGLDNLEAAEEPIRPSRISSVLEKVRGLRDEAGTEAEREHLAEAERRLHDLLDSEYVDADRDESDEES